MRTAAIAYALAILVVGLIVTLVMTRETETEKQEAVAAKEEAEKQPKPLPGDITPGPEIAERVEQIRGQAFNGKAPEVQVVPEAELEKQLTALDATPPSDKGLATASALLLAQAGALPAKQAEQLVARRYGGTGVLGAYLPEGRKVLVSRELAEEEPEVAELVAAHELARALDAGPAKDAPRVPPLFRDDEAAKVALRGGVATQVERQYAAEHLGRDRSEDSEVQLSRDARDAPDTPPLLQTLSAFPSEVGGAFVAGVHERGGWDAVDELLGEPPSTTAELLHRDAGAPVPAPEFSVQPLLGEEYKRVATADVGELDTIGLLRAGVGEDEAAEAASGWRSGRFETYVKGGKPCPPPCRRQSASVVVWRFADDAASLAFVRAMRQAVIEGAAARPEGGRGFVVGDGGAALVRAGRFAALTFAPDAPTAGELATTALEG
ncbi:MAG TPA: hypothetical protein VF529_07745 [Solirubrobacteraceae bacterium]|jgi:hypothetical protein